MRVRGREQIWLHHPLATSTSRSFTALHLTLLICKMGQQKQLLHSKVRVTQKLAQAELSSWPPCPFHGCSVVKESRHHPRAWTFLLLDPRDRVGGTGRAGQSPVNRNQRFRTRRAEPPSHPSCYQLASWASGFPSVKWEAFWDADWVATVQWLSVADSLRPHGLQHTRPPYPSPSPGACSNSRPLS